jgi:hypothetical protein
VHDAPGRAERDRVHAGWQSRKCVLDLAAVDVRDLVADTAVEWAFASVSLLFYLDPPLLVARFFSVFGW